MKPGKVYIVGAGPGDPGLITLRALEILKQADVIVYDRLINNDLLSFCKDSSEKIFVGKESGFHPIEQEHITEILINKSKSGFSVARIKGGNPFIFGRGSEEAMDLKKAGIEYEIVPGVTSGFAAPVYSGIPITQRGLITQCVFITAHECPEKPGTQVEWEKLAKMKNTSLIIYMGASRIEIICQTLIKYGTDPSTPAAAIENGTLPKQRTITARLDELPGKFKEQNFHAPVIIMISPTVSLREGICWYEKKPFFNKRIAIVGTENSPGHFHTIFNNSGAEILNIPVLKTNISIPEKNLNELFANNDFDWILFSSEEGVNYFFDLLKRENLDTRVIGKRKIAVIGNGTCERLKSFGLIPDYSMIEFNAKSFKESFVEIYDTGRKKLLRINDNSPPDNINEALTASGTHVNTLVVFHTLLNQPEPELISNLEQSPPDYLIFTGQLSIDNFFNALGSKTAAEILNKSGSISVNPLTTDDVINKNILKDMPSNDFSSEKVRDVANRLV